ncbi:hypothetical protein [Leptospira santarosai]|uniref:hypothetical protein n=1 Tax=Leptospira santarosai TaxID=28183 RepID=UPI0004745B91|nr:hypothetical protein [Leptospira santarosai]
MNLKNDNIAHFKNGGQFEYNNLFFGLKDGSFTLRPIWMDDSDNTGFYCRSLRPYPFMTLKKIIRGQWGRRVDFK